MRTLSSFLGVFAAAALTLGACSSSGPTDGSSDPNSNTSGNQPGGGGGGGGGGGAGQYSCCLNSVYYACADKAAFDKCMGFDFGACDAKCGLSDFQCHQSCMDQATKASHDPSSCSRQAGACPTTGGGGGGGGSCTFSGIGNCTIDSDCGSDRHCTNGKCFSNALGSKCTIDSDCGSDNHCTNGCCLSNMAGSKCTIDSDCGSGNHCTNGTCYMNAFGSPCTIDSDCGSGNSCVNGKCK